MKAMFIAFVGIFVIAIAADQVLNRAGFAIDEVTSAPSVRLD